MGKSKIDVIFEDSERGQQALQNFIDPSFRSETNSVEVFTVKDYFPLLLKLSTTLREGCRYLPFHLVVNAITKVWESSPLGLIPQIQWMAIVELLCKELGQTEEDEFHEMSIILALKKMSTLAWSSFDIILAKFRGWPTSLRLQAIVLLNNLLLSRPSQVQSIPNFVSLLLVDYIGGKYNYEIVLALGSLLVTVVDESTCLDFISSSSLPVKFMTILESQDMEIIKAYKVLPLISTLVRRSSSLESKFIMEEKISSTLVRITPFACGHGDSDIVEQITDTCYYLARCSNSILSDDQYWEFARDILNIGMTIVNNQYYSSNTSTKSPWKVFDVFERVIGHMSREAFKRLVFDTRIPQFFIGYLTYSNDVSLLQKIIKLMEKMAEKDGIFREIFFQEGGMHALKQVQSMRRPSLSHQAYDFLTRIRVKEDTTYVNYIKCLKEKLEKQLSCVAVGNDGEVEDTIIDILKEMESFEMTAYEFLQSGLVDVLLDYFSNPNISPMEELKLVSKEQRLSNRIMKLLGRCRDKCESSDQLISAMVKALSKALYFVDASRMHLKLGEDHHCTGHPEFTGTLPCCLRKSDPRHDILLLLSLVDKVIRSIPISDVYEAADRSLAIGSSEDEERVMSGYKEASLTHSYPMIICVHVAFPACKILTSSNAEASALHLDYVDEFISAYPFASSLQFRREYMEAMYNILSDNEIREVEVSRDTILESAMEVMEELSTQWESEQYELHVKFKGEEGQGPGPTREFYTVVCEELQNPKSGMWRENKSGGLFPRPYQDGDEGLERAVSNFKLLGYVMATGLVDGHLLDLNLSPAFYKLAILQQPLSEYDILSFDPEMGLQFLQLKSLDMRRHKLLNTSSCKKSPHEIDNSKLKFKGTDLGDLYYGYELPNYPGYRLTHDEDKILDMDNLEKYLQDVSDATLVTGVSRQIDAFREGFGHFCGAMSCFEPHEMKTILCGEDVRQDWAWSPEELHQHLNFQFIEDYDQDDRREIRSWVIETVVGFDDNERSNFLKFITGSVRVPKGGLGKMNPKLTILVFTRSGNLAALPSAATCAHLLRLPFYASKAMLRDKLLLAMSEGQGSFGFY